MGVILECTYLFRINVIFVEVIVLFADEAVFIGESDIGARFTRNRDCVRDSTCGNRGNRLLLADYLVFTIDFFVERYCDIGESVLRFVLKIDFLVAVANVLFDDIVVGSQL